jgi:phosphate-selective porin OprO and OprP
MRTDSVGAARLAYALAAFCALATGRPSASAQEADAPTSPPAAPNPVPAAPPDGALLERLRKMEEQLDQVTRQNERLRKMEERVEQVSRRNEQLTRENQRLDRQYQELLREVRAPAPAPTSTADAGATAGGGPRDDRGVAKMAGGGSKVSGGDPTTTGRAQEVGNPRLGKLPLKSHYDFDDDGFNWATEDDEFTLGIRGMSQLDSRIYEQANQNPATGGFYNPRTRVYFEGHFTKPIQYEFSFQNFYDVVQLLDAYINFNYDPRFQLRIGRYKTPFTYEWYRIHIWHLLSPERSLYASNFEGNRRFGLMGWGVLFDNRLEYAVGTFDTQRNSFQPFGNLQDVMAFLNFKPFFNGEEGFLPRDLQVGGSVDAGHENQPTVPAVLRTNLGAPSGAGISSASAANSASVPFLAFNSDVRERGYRALWELHTAYYYGGLTLLGAWQGGLESYSKGSTGAEARIPIGGWFAQVGYIITGETIRDRTLIQPLHPFDLRRGSFGLGAFELTARYSELDLSSRVFTAGLSDPNLWTNRVEMTDVGFNWYMNKFVKVYFDWEHAMFAQPVSYAPGPRFQKTSDLFWLRFQVYF